LRILITGASGFIGRHLAIYLRSQNHDVLVDVAERASRGRITLTTQLLQSIVGSDPLDAIIHCAGSGTVGQVAADPANHISSNLIATLAVLEFARMAAPRTRVVFLSSAAVYGDAPAEPQSEQVSRAPVSLYGLSKRQSEELMAHYAARFDLQCTSIRLFSVYGPGLRKQLLWDAMNKFVSGNPSFFGTGREVRDWVHVDDVCNFISHVLTAKAASSHEVYNCGGQAVTTADVLTELSQLGSSQAIKLAFNGQIRAGDPQCLIADCSKANQLLNWRAGRQWREGMAEYRQWFLNASAQNEPML
jgi:UDP-glucose 4-epimerase